jgi:hypothetical protein
VSCSAIKGVIFTTLALQLIYCFYYHASPSYGTQCSDVCRFSGRR